MAVASLAPAIAGVRRGRAAPNPGSTLSRARCRRPQKGYQQLTGLSPEILKPVVGTVLIAVAALMLLAPKVNCPDRFAPLAGPLVGVGGGMLGGLAGQPGPIVFLYLLSCGVSGGRFVQYSSMYVALASVALTLAMGRAGAIGLEGAAFSAICTIPILFGMWVGQRVREVVSAGLFRKLVLGMVVLGGFSMVEPALSIIFAAHASGSAMVAQHRPSDSASQRHKGRSLTRAPLISAMDGRLGAF